MSKNADKVVNAAEDENINNWVWKLSKPVTYNGEEVSELTFNFEKITGRDAIEIEGELISSGKIALYSQVSNVHYIIRVAARACEKPIGIDIFDLVSISDFNSLRTHTQLFLVRTPQ